MGVRGREHSRHPTRVVSSPALATENKVCGRSHGGDEQNNRLQDTRVRERQGPAHRRWEGMATVKEKLAQSKEGYEQDSPVKLDETAERLS